MYNKVLIISDNIVLSQKFNDIITDLHLIEVEWDFAISPYSDVVQFEKVLNKKLRNYDLRKNIDVNEIIKNYDLVFSLHCKQLFPVKMIGQLKCINIHPGYNPINRGWYPQVFAIVNDLSVGATIHEIDDKLDHGPIIARKLVEKNILDTSETLYSKIIDAEVELIKENIASILKDTYTTFLPEEVSFLNLKEDFNKLCKLDLNEKLTTLQFINKLRALTHGDFKNAYFIDPTTNEAVYVSINLEKL